MQTTHTATSFTHFGQSFMHVGPVRRTIVLALGAVLALTLAQAQHLAAQSPTPRVTIDTELGAIEVELYPDKAPATVANFLRYVESGHYDGGSFFRTVTMENQPHNDVKIEVIQAGTHPWQDNFAFDPIRLETTEDTGVLHLDGAISMARAAPHSARSSFFICIGDQPELDFGGRRNPDGQGFAAFGRVVEGMDVVRAIQSAPARGQALIPTVDIQSVGIGL